VGLAEQLEEAAACASLTYKQRVIGCGCCMAAGFILSLGSWLRFGSLMHGEPAPFAVAAVLGSLVALAGSLFLAGPVAQCKSMFASTRWVTTLVFLLALAAVLAACFVPDVPHRTFFIVVFLLVSYVAETWYVLSYIPFARTLAAKLCRRTVAGATGV